MDLADEVRRRYVEADPTAAMVRKSNLSQRRWVGFDVRHNLAGTSR